MYSYAVYGKCEKDGNYGAFRFEQDAINEENAKAQMTTVLADAGYTRISIERAEVLRRISQVA